MFLRQQACLRQETQHRWTRAFCARGDVNLLIDVRVVANSKKAEVKMRSEGMYEVKVDAPAVDGKANSRLVEILSDYFKVPKSKIRLVRGNRSRNKTIDIGAEAG